MPFWIFSFIIQNHFSRLVIAPVADAGAVASIFVVWIMLWLLIVYFTIVRLPVPPTSYGLHLLVYGFMARGMRSSVFVFSGNFAFTSWPQCELQNVHLGENPIFLRMLDGWLAG